MPSSPAGFSSVKLPAALVQQAREAARIERSRVDMTPCGTAGMAYVMSQAAVKMLLRAPATAQFPASPSVAASSASWACCSGSNERIVPS